MVTSYNTLPYHTQYHKKQFRMYCISIEGKAIKLLEENINIYLHDLEFAKYFLNRAQKLLIRRKMIDNLIISKIGNYTYGKTRDRLGDLRV